MPALTGQLSYARFFVEEKLPRDFLDASHEAIVHRAMQPLDANAPESERSGWCVLGDPLETTMPRERVYLDGYLNLGFRTDKWAIPGPLLKTKLREAELKYLDKKGRERLGKREKAEIKEVVVRELRKKLVPVTRAIDLTWSLEEGVVRFFSHSDRPTQEMLELFKATFGIELVAESPFTLGRRIGLTDDQFAAWEVLEQTVIERQAS